MESENHDKKLKETCRTCGNRIKLDPKSYKTPKESLLYRAEIISLFHHDVENDENCPPYVCSACRRKLDKCKNTNGTFKTHDSLPIFHQHSPSDCNVCIKKKPNPTFSVQFSSVNKITTKSMTILEAAELFNFTNLTHLSSITENKFCFAKFHLTTTGLPSISFFLCVKKDSTWYLSVEENVTPQLSLAHLPHEMNNFSAETIFEYADKLKLCKGNDDYPELFVNCIDQTFKDRSGNIIGYIESKNFQRVSSFTTIRSTNCHVFDESRCSPCSELRNHLRKLVWRKRRGSEESVPKKNTPNVYLTKPQLETKVGTLQKEVRILRRNLTSVKATVSKIMEAESHSLPSSIAGICDDVFSKNSYNFQEDSPLQLLWEEQKKQQSLADKRSMRWHPVIIRWCVAVFLKSPGAYQLIKDSGFLMLPSKKTLQKYTNFTEPSCGFNPDVISTFLGQVQKENGTLHVGLVHDEMKIKSGLAFNKNSGKIVGFTDLGDLNNEMEEFNVRVEGNATHQPIASHILTIMVKGLTSRISFPIAYFAGQGFTGYQLYPVMWEAVRILEAVGISVWFITSDGAAPNRKFYRLHHLEDHSNVSVDGVVYWTWNRFALPERRKLYFMCDVPHLMKTTRNNFANSNAHSNTRKLFLEGKDISWQHIISLLGYDLGADRVAPGFHQTKLTAEHVYLTPRSRMNVSLAVQVLSNSVAVALENQNNENTTSTRMFVSYFNKFFDCLNVRDQLDGVKKRNKSLLPYTSATDARFKWVLCFIKFLNDWQASTSKAQGKTKEERNRMCLSVQTLEGLRITARSFLELTPTLLENGVQYVLTDKMNQDSLEEHFGRQRSRLGACDNPTVQQYAENELKLQVSKSDLIHNVKGNTRGRKGPNKLDTKDMTSLPKKRKNNNDNTD